jgi:hypothetical protein
MEVMLLQRAIGMNGCVCLGSTFSFGFSFRHDTSGEGSSDISVRVRNLKLGISTFWSLEKFESKLAAMKELYEVWNVTKISLNFFK